MNMTTTFAFIGIAILLAGGFVWATFYTSAPYDVFAWALVAAGGAYGTKRLFQKQKKFSGSPSGPGDNDCPGDGDV